MEDGGDMALKWVAWNEGIILWLEVLAFLSIMFGLKIT